MSKFTDADAEQMETQPWVSEALDCGYITLGEAEQLSSELEEIGRMLNSMMEKADSFCSASDIVLQKVGTDYFVADVL